MVNLVIDSSVAVKWFVTEAHTPEALSVLADYENGSLSFLAPDLIFAELGNILWKKQTMQGLPPDVATQALDQFQALSISVTSTAALLDDAYLLAVSYKRTVYDMLYLALSLREQCRFITADEKLVNAVGASYPNVVWLPAWSGLP